MEHISFIQSLDGHEDPKLAIYDYVKGLSYDQFIKYIKMVIKDSHGSLDTLSDSIYTFTSRRRGDSPDQYIDLTQLLIDSNDYKAVQYILWHIFPKDDKILFKFKDRAIVKGNLNSEKAILDHMNDILSPEDLKRFNAYDIEQIDLAKKADVIKKIMKNTSDVDVLIKGTDKLYSMSSRSNVNEFLVEVLDNKEDWKNECKLLLYAGLKKDYELLSSLYEGYLDLHDLYDIQNLEDLTNTILDLDDYTATYIMATTDLLSVLEPAIKQKLVNVVKAFYDRMPYLTGNLLLEHLDFAKEHSLLPSFEDSIKTTDSVGEFVLCLSQTKSLDPQDLKAFLKRMEIVQDDLIRIARGYKCESAVDLLIKASEAKG